MEINKFNNAGNPEGYWEELSFDNIHELYYKNGRKHGSFLCRNFNNGQVLMEGSYKMNRKIGLWTYSNSVGIIYEECIYII